MSKTDVALANSLNTALPGRLEDDREVAATQEDEEEDEEEEGEEEDQQDDDEEEVAPRQAQVAPQEGVVDQGAVITQCLAAQARARRSVYKGAQASAAAAFACVFAFLSSSPRPARRSRPMPTRSILCSFRPHINRLPVRQSGAMIRCVKCLLLVCSIITCRQWGLNGNIGKLRQTDALISPPRARFGTCQTDPPCLQSRLLMQDCHHAGTSDTVRPEARLTGSAFARIVSNWGYRGVRVGEASHPGPEGGEPPRVTTIYRIPVGDKASKSCSIRLTPQGGAWIWIVHSSPPLRVAGRKTPAEALQKWLQKFQDYIIPDSRVVLRELQEQWQAHPIPPPPPKASAGRRARSAPPPTGREEAGSPETGDMGASQANSLESPGEHTRSNRRVCKNLEGSAPISGCSSYTPPGGCCQADEFL